MACTVTMQAVHCLTVKLDVPAEAGGRQLPPSCAVHLHPAVHKLCWFWQLPAVMQGSAPPCPPPDIDCAFAHVSPVPPTAGFGSGSCIHRACRANWVQRQLPVSTRADCSALMPPLPRLPTVSCGMAWHRSSML